MKHCKVDLQPFSANLIFCQEKICNSNRNKMDVGLGLWKEKRIQCILCFDSTELFPLVKSRKSSAGHSKIKRMIIQERQFSFILKQRSQVEKIEYVYAFSLPIYLECLFLCTLVPERVQLSSRIIKAILLSAVWDRNFIYLFPIKN